MRKPFLMSFTTNPFWRFTNITLKHLDTVTDSRRRSLISCSQHTPDGLHRKWRNLSHSGIHSCSRHTQFEKKCLNLTKVTTFCNYIPLNEGNFSKCNIRLIKVLKYWKPDFHDWLIVCYSLFVCLGCFFLTRYFFTHVWRRHYNWWMAAIFYLYSVLMVIEQWEFFRMSHLLRHGKSVYDGHFQGSVTLTLLRSV